MAWIDAALHSLDPIALLHTFGDVAVRSRDQVPFEGWELRKRIRERSEIRPNDTVPLAGSIRDSADLGVEVGFGGLVGHLDTRAVDSELPAVIHASEAGFFVAPEEQRRATV